MKRRGKTFKVLMGIWLFFWLIVGYSWSSDNSYYFLKEGVGARALGMGGAFSAVSDDATAPLWNPAGMAQYDSRKAAMMHANQFDMDIYYNYVGYVQPVSYWGSFGFSYANLNTGFIPVTSQLDNLGMPIIDRYVSDNESAFVFSWAKGLANKKGSLGLNVKFLTQTFGDEHGRGVDMDLGFLFHATDNFALSIVLQDFLIGKMNWDGEDDDLDLTVKTGISGRFFENRVVVALDTDFAEGRPAVWHIGAEYNINDSFAIRFGSNDSNLTGGLSIKAKNWIFDYAYEDHDLGPTHRVSARIDFDDEFPWRERYRERKKLRPLEPAKKILVKVENVDTTKNPPKVYVEEPKKEKVSPKVAQTKNKVVNEKAKLVKYYEDMADRYAVAGKYDDAIPVYKKILKIDSDRPDILLKLGKAYKYKHDYVRANRVFGYIIKRYSDTPYKEKAMMEMVENSAPSAYKMKSSNLKVPSLPAENKVDLGKKISSKKEVVAEVKAKKDENKIQNNKVELLKNKPKLAVVNANKIVNTNKNQPEIKEVKKAEVKIASLETGKKEKKVEKVIASAKKQISTKKKFQSSPRKETIVVKASKTSQEGKKQVYRINDVPKIKAVVKVKKQTETAKVKVAKTEVKTSNNSNKINPSKKLVVNNLESNKKNTSSDEKKSVSKLANLVASVSVEKVSQKITPKKESKPKTSSVVAAASFPSFSDEKLVAHYYRKGNEYYMKGEYQKAIVLYEKVLEHRPNSIGIRFIMGNNYILLGQYNKAKQMYQEIIQKDKNGSYAIKARILLRKLEKNFDNKK